LPAQTYVKGFLRSYAEYLGLDGQLYVDEYNSRFVAGEEEPQSRPRRSAPPPSRGVQVQSRVVLLTLLGIVSVTALVIVAWTRGEPQQVTPVGLGSPKATTHQTPVVPAASNEDCSNFVFMDIITIHATESCNIDFMNDPGVVAMVKCHE